MKIKEKKWWILAFLVLVVVTGVFFLLPLYKKSPVLEKTSIPLTIHTDYTYGFSIAFPKGILPEQTFQKFYLLSNQWMAGASENSKGKPLLSIPIYRFTNDSTYPRYWDVEVRIGITTDPEELKTFLSESAFGEEPPQSVVINGITFYQFPITDAGMMQILEGYSYRTIHNGTGYAIEPIKTGSTYREKENPKDIPDAILDSYYEQTKKIVQSFQWID